MYTSSKYSSQTNQELEVRALDVLANSQEALSIQQIQRHDMILAEHTPQKLTRVLGKLIDMGFVKKAKHRTSNRMVYKAVSVMLAQGYQVDIDEESVAAAVISTAPITPNWELTAEKSI